jgi:hypothetical protein
MNNGIKLGRLWQGNLDSVSLLVKQVYRRRGGTASGGT